MDKLINKIKYTAVLGSENVSTARCGCGSCFHELFQEIQTPTDIAVYICIQLVN